MTPPPVGAASTSVRRRRWLWSAAAAWTLVTLLLVGALPFDRASDRPQAVLDMVAYLGFSTVGLLVVRRHPRHPVAWAFLGSAVTAAMEAFGRDYGSWAFHGSHDVPLVRASIWVSTWAWVPTLMLPLVYGLLLFPDGRPPTPRWRWVGWVAAVAMVGFLVPFGAAAATQPERVLLSNNVPTTGADHAIFVASRACFVVLLACAAAAVASLVVRYARSRGDHRQQLKLVVLAAVVAVLLNVAVLWVPSLQNAAESIGVALIPAAAGVAILRYRLYDIDRIVSRTVSYGVVTALLIGLYVGCVALTTSVLAFGSSFGVAASTLAAAAAFQPLRRRVQRVVDRRFDRAAYDAQQTVEAFSTRLRDAVAVETVSDDLLATATTAVAPTTASLWVAS